jgi:hypothetical protein
MKIYTLPWILTVSFALFISSCKRDHYKVNVSSIRADVEVKRLEKDLFESDPGAIASKVPELKTKYGSFLQLFSYVINAGNVDSSSFGEALGEFCTDKQNNDVFDLTMKVYPDVEKIREGLEGAFRHYLYYFPGKQLPSVFTCITGFNNSIITGDSVLGVGLDRYLGKDCKYYPALEIYTYMSAKMTPDYIVPDCLYGWGASEWDFSSMKYQTENVLAEMLHEGKLKYFEKCMLPDTPDELIFGFTEPQLKFCMNNEGNMWQYLVEHDLIFKTDQLLITKLIGEAPFTTFFSNESPGKAAVWIGFRIVESYMKKNSGVSLGELMSEKDFQTILEKARYNPQ